MKKKSLFDVLIDAMAFLAGILLVLAVLIECFEIWMRYFAHRPQAWTVEVCEYILFGVAFLGAPWLLKKGGHVSVDIMVERLGQRNRTISKLFTSCAGIFISAVISWFSLVAAWDSYKSGAMVTKTLSLPKHYFLLLIFLGYLLLCMEFARHFASQFRELGTIRKKTE